MFYLKQKCFISLLSPSCKHTIADLSIGMKNALSEFLIFPYCENLTLVFHPMDSFTKVIISSTLSIPLPVALAVASFAYNSAESFKCFKNTCNICVKVYNVDRYFIAGKVIWFLYRLTLSKCKNWCIFYYAHVCGLGMPYLNTDFYNRGSQ